MIHRLTCFALLLLAACSSPSPVEPFGQVEEDVASRLGQQIRWRRDGAEDREVERSVAALLERPLSASAAVQVGLLRNASLQAEYERLGVSQAELVQAGLLSNPVFAASARFADRSPSMVNLEFGVAQDFLDLLVRSAREDLARAQLAQTRQEVTAAVLDHAAAIRVAYYECLGAEQVARMRRLVVEASGSSAELARRLHEAGNISDRQLASEIGLYEDARISSARADSTARARREELTRQMGLWGAEVDWTLPEGLPEIPDEEMSLQGLESLAIARRFDLAAARQESEVLAQALGITRDWRFLGMLEVGVSSERDTDGQFVTGPEIALELPIFDRGQAELARQAALLRRADQRVLALAVQIRSEVRELRDQLLTRRRLARHYREVVIPLRESIVRYAQQEFNYMLLGVFEVIAAKQDEYDAYQEYLETVAEYWVLRARLGRALGGAVGDERPDDPAAATPVETPGADPQPAGHEGHQHGPKAGGTAEQDPGRVDNGG